MCCARLRNKIWKTFEEPNSSTAAKVRFIVTRFLLTMCMQVLVVVSSFFLLASIFMLILSTVPEFQVGQNIDGFAKYETVKADKLVTHRKSLWKGKALARK